ncbi:MAG: thioredoxin domain-containing protein [Frankiaceae bacterium]|nr:thioredoxin domain-containing protein [Frankiaceae bacterium]MBV9872806.1 thioredoxin domain-containing protein [Frankiaceae bacterium]
MTTGWTHYEGASGVLTEPVDETRDHIMGPSDAAVTLVEYGDYQCPFCVQAHPVVAALLKADGPPIRYVFRHFPLTTVHPLAEPAAEAAEAAAAQDRFWPMHDVLFSNSPALEGEDLRRYARALGLDERKFVRDLVERVHAPRVRADFLTGVRSGVSGTPTFFIDGVRHDGAFDYPVLRAAVEAAARSSAGRR